MSLDWLMVGAVIGIYAAHIAWLASFSEADLGDQP